MVYCDQNNEIWRCCLQPINTRVVIVIGVGGGVGGGVGIGVLVGVDVVDTLTHRHTRIKIIWSVVKKTGSNNSGVKECLRKKMKRNKTNKGEATRVSAHQHERCAYRMGKAGKFTKRAS